MKSIGNASFAITFDDQTGAIQSIRQDQCELAAPAAVAFTLQLLDRDGNPTRLAADDFHYDGTRHTGSLRFPTLAVTLKSDCRDRFVRFRIQVTGVPPTHVLEWVDAPQICYPTGRKLLQPKHDGIIITDPELRNRNPSGRYHPIQFAERGLAYGCYFPGRAQMQFMAVYDESGGFYFAAHDPACTTKAVEYEPLPDGRTRLSLQTFTGCDFGQDYETPFDYVVTAFTGAWQDACLIYRQWVESHTAAAPVDFPEYLEDSPVLLIYPVRGHGLDTGEMDENCYYPYVNVLEYVEKFNRELDSRVMPLLMHWEGTAPWAPPYVWPPYGGVAALAALRDGLHEQGNRLGLYCSGTAWTCRSCITDYAPGCTAEQAADMLTGPRGELDASVCNGVNSQRLGYDLCLTETWPRATIQAEILKLAEFGVDYAQFFDQNHGGGMHLCYSHTHRHAPVPGAWQTAAMRSLMHETVAAMQKIGHPMLLGCESAAAEPYVDYLALNDARASFAGWFGEPVPAQQFVFHGRSLNFSGNQCGARQAIDLERSPENMLYRLAYAFNAGDLLALPLKENGRIHWCWALEWDAPAPEQQPILTLVRNLNRLRRRHPEWLLRGRMIIDAVAVAGDTVSWYDHDGATVTRPAFFHSAWVAPDGARARIITNTLPREQHITLDGAAMTLPPLNAVIMTF